MAELANSLSSEVSIYEKMRTTRREIKRVQKQLDASIADLATEQEKLKSLDVSLTSELENARKTQLEDAIATAAFPLIQKSNELSELIDSLDAEMSEQLAHFSRDKIADLVHEQVEEESVYNSLTVIREALIESMGASLFKRVLSTYSVDTVSPNTYNKALNTLSNSLPVPRLRKFSEFIADTTVRISNLGLLSSGKLSISIIFGVISFIIMLVLAPLVLVCCTVLAGRNILVVSRVRRVMYSYVVCMDNYREREKVIEELVDSLFKDKEQEINDTYGVAFTKLESLIGKLIISTEAAKEKAKSEFVFDENPILEQFKSNRLILEQKVDDISKTLTQDRNRLNDLQVLLEVLDKKMDEETELTIKKYLDTSTVGSEKIFPTAFLMVDKRPLKYFESADTSVLLAFKDYILAEDLGRLICAEVRTIMAPGTVQIQIWDSKKSGVRFLPFAGLNDKKGRGDELLFQLHSSTSAFKDQLEAFDSMLQKRLRMIQASYPNIASYNRDMIALGSVPESYVLLLVYYPEALLNDERFYRLLSVGPPLGIFTYVFCEEDVLTESHFPVFDAVGQCVKVLPDYPATVAVMALRSEVLSKKDKSSSGSL